MGLFKLRIILLFVFKLKKNQRIELISFSHFVEELANMQNFWRKALPTDYTFKSSKIFGIIGFKPESIYNTFLGPT